jgi:hypothetical protein
VIALPLPWAAIEALGTWFGGIATAGSLWLGFMLLRGDRLREVRAQASQVVIYPSVFMRANPEGTPVDHVTLRLDLWNLSDKLISTAVVHGLDFDYLVKGTHNGFIFGINDPDWITRSLIFPGQTRDLTYREIRETDVMKISVTFEDAKGRIWLYLVESGRLIGLRRTRTFRQYPDGTIGVHRWYKWPRRLKDSYPE